MPWTRITRQLPFVSLGSYLLLAGIPVAALAATETARALDLGNWRWWAVLGFVQGITLIGYFASSLNQWAGWIDGTTLQRLTIIQGMIASIMAGNVAYFLGLHYAGLTEVMALMASGAGGFGGDKFLTPLLGRIFGKATDK